MSFSNISFKHTNTDVNYNLQDVVIAKFQSLEKYLGSGSDSKCEIEFVKVAPSQNGDIYQVEANLWTEGVLYRAVDTASTFEKAIDAVRSDLDAELQKARTRKMSLWRKGARRIKQMMQRGE